MATTTFSVLVDEPALERLGELIAFDLRRGDIVTLAGDLGAGKTTLARAIIRAVLDDATAEVPSPTFALAQSYDAARCPIMHCDLYRLAGAEEAAELGLDEALAAGAVLIEWPERAAGILPAERLEIELAEADGGARRQIGLTASGDLGSRLDRLMRIQGFLDREGWQDATLRALPGDASSRRYLRIAAADGRRAMLMDAPRQPDGPPIRDGLPYSRIAHLAEDVRPFVAVAGYLSGRGLSAPHILASDLEAGLLLIEDLGDIVFGVALAAGASQLELWRGAVDAILVLAHAPPPALLPVAPGLSHAVPRFDRSAMQIEVELLPDWYVPALTGAPLDGAVRDEYLAHWNAVFDQVLAMPAGLILRDYHSPNLLRLPDRAGAAGTGIIDFQDALIGPVAYDLVSLLQDARLDVPAQIEAELKSYYEQEAARREPGFDRAVFDFAYAALGAQRNTKILGIFARLARRDHKPRYLQHIPRIWRYLERDLAHPGLAVLRSWYDRVLPPPRGNLPPTAKSY